MLVVAARLVVGGMRRPEVHQWKAVFGINTTAELARAVKIVVRSHPTDVMATSNGYNGIYHVIYHFRGSKEPLNAIRRLFGPRKSNLGRIVYPRCASTSFTLVPAVALKAVEPKVV